MDLPTPRIDKSGDDELRGISLCAGYGGLDLGLHIAEPGYRTVCYVERESHAAATLVARMADASLAQAPVWSDLVAFDGRPWRNRVHLVAAGYPCQPFSTSGKRRGDADPRHLWPHVARIIREVRPRWVFCENVEGHLDLGFPDVCRELQAMGFDVAAGVFAAAEVGAPHLRRRMFLLANADRRATGLCSRPDHKRRSVSIGQPHKLAADERRPVQSHAGGYELDGVMADDACARRGFPMQPDRLFAPGPDQFHAWEGILGDRPDLQPALLGMDDGVADWMDRSRGVGNGVCSLAAALAFRTLRDFFIR